MNTKSSDCPICLINYDSEEHFPMIVGKCGHTICILCVKSLSVCPLCTHQIDQNNLIRNYAVVNLIEQYKASKPVEKPSNVQRARIFSQEQKNQLSISRWEGNEENEEERPHQNKFLGLNEDAPPKQYMNKSFRTRVVNNKPKPRINEPPEPMPTREYCSRRHPLAFYKLSPGMAWCHVCKRPITGKFAGCKICEYDICCQINNEFDFQHHFCDNQHELGYSEHPNSQVECWLCRKQSSWICRRSKCPYNYCQSCIEKVPEDPQQVAKMGRLAQVAWKLSYWPGMMSSYQPRGFRRG